MSSAEERDEAGGRVVRVEGVVDDDADEQRRTRPSTASAMIVTRKPASRRRYGRASDQTAAPGSGRSAPRHGGLVAEEQVGGHPHQRERLGGYSAKTRWRRVWDSNPRWPHDHNGSRDRPIRPLWQLSVDEAYRRRSRDAAREGTDERGCFGGRRRGERLARGAAGVGAEVVERSRTRPPSWSMAPNTTRRGLQATIAPPHIGHGSTVTTTVAPVRRQPSPMAAAAPRRASTSDGAVGSPDCSRSLWRRATTLAVDHDDAADRHVPVTLGQRRLVEGLGHGGVPLGRHVTSAPTASGTRAPSTSKTRLTRPKASQLPMQMASSTSRRRRSPPPPPGGGGAMQLRPEVVVEVPVIGGEPSCELGGHSAPSPPASVTRSPRTPPSPGGRERLVGRSGPAWEAGPGRARPWRAGAPGQADGAVVDLGDG